MYPHLSYSFHSSASRRKFRMNDTTLDPGVGVAITKVVTWEQIASTMVSAFEGGSRYWCDGQVDLTIPDPNNPGVRIDAPYKEESAPGAYDAGPSYSQPEFWSNPGWQMIVRFHETEWDDEAVPMKEITVGPEDLKTGLQLLADKWPHHFDAIVGDGGDAWTGDALLQAVVLKDLVYG